MNFVVRRVKKMVPAWSLPGHIKFNTAIAEGARHEFKPVKQGPDDVAFLQYTGGTTGVAKGATLLHRNLIANVLQSQVWLDPARAGRDGHRPVHHGRRAAAVSHFCADGLRTADRFVPAASAC